MEISKKYKSKQLVGVLLAALLLPLLSSGRVNAWELDPIAENSESKAEWNIQCMNAENSYKESKGYEKVKVAIIDSGLDYDTDIPFVEREDFLEEDVEAQLLYEDYTGHGTSVASLICAKENDDRISGIAANVELYSARVLDEENQAPVSRVVRAIDWAICKQVKIIHMSFGTKEHSRELRSAVQRAQKAGILIIAAAGNNGTAAEDESTIEYPAAYPEVMAVGATDTGNAKSELSSSGEEMDVVAPGDKILSMGAFGGVAVDEGTSYSAAQVTGIAAVLWGKYPQKSAEFIRGLLTASANKQAVTGDCGEGMVDYQEAKEDYKTLESGYRYFKKMGKNEKTAVACAMDTVDENRKKMESHADINYVNGTWKEAKHKGLLKKQKIKNMSLVKLGATKPDSLEKMKGLKAHPYFHGGENFFASTQYLLAAARHYKNGGKKPPTYEQAFQDGANLYSTGKLKNVKKGLENAERGKENLYKGIKSLDSEKKAYVLLGVAIHNMTDSCAHQAMIQLPAKYGGWRKIIHHKTSVTTELKKKCQYAKWEKWSKNKKNMASPVLKQWLKKVAIADDTQKLGPLCDAAKDMVPKLIAKFDDAVVKDKEGKEKNVFCYDEIADALIENKSDIEKKKLAIYNLKGYWNELSPVTKKEEEFGAISQKAYSYSHEVPKKIEYKIEKGKLVVSQEQFKENVLYDIRVKPISGKDIHLKKEKNSKNMSVKIESGKGKKKKLKTLIVTTYTPKEKKEKKQSLLYQVTFKNGKGKKNWKLIIYPNTSVAIPKKMKPKKAKKWIQTGSVKNPVTFTRGKKIAYKQAGKIKVKAVKQKEKKKKSKKSKKKG